MLPFKFQSKDTYRTLTSAPSIWHVCVIVITCLLKFAIEGRRGYTVALSSHAVHIPTALSRNGV